MDNKPESERKRTIMLVVVVGLIVALLPMAIAFRSNFAADNPHLNNDGEATEATQGDDPRAITNLAFPVQCVGNDYSDLSAPGDSDLAEISLPCLTDGNVDAPSYNLAQAAHGRVSVINMWAYWCEPCRTEIPYFAKLAQEHPEWNVVGVHADQNPSAGIGTLSEIGVNLSPNYALFPSFSDIEGEFGKRAGLAPVMPQTVIYSPDGTRLAVLTQSFSSYEELEQAIQKVLG